MEPTTTPANPETKPSDLKPLAEDIAADVKLVMQVVQAIKEKGTVAGITANAPAIVAEVQKDIRDVEAALPSIKSGWKTSEFWLIAAFLAGNAVYTAVTGKTLPIDTDALLGTVLAVYAGVRVMLKKSA